MYYVYHDESIIKNLPANTVFVFGSNLAGTHQGGAAKMALQYFGAMKGVGRGWSGQSFAIPTMNEHLQQMPLSQIQHYIHDFKIYTRNHPKIEYFITAIGCGVAGYKVEEIAPMFKGISNNVILPISFQAFVEENLPTLNQNLLKSIFNHALILSDQPEQKIAALKLSEAEKSLATILLNTPMFPNDSNGRDRSFEINDILKNLNQYLIEKQQHLELSESMGGVILALLELYQMNELDFVHVLTGSQNIPPPQPASHS